MEEFSQILLLCSLPDPTSTTSFAAFTDKYGFTLKMPHFDFEIKVANVKDNRNRDNSFHSGSKTTTH